MITTDTIDVTTTPVKLADNSLYGVFLRNVTASETIYLGGDDSVDASTGFPWNTTDPPWSIEPERGEELWAMVVTAPQTVKRIAQGR